MPWTELFWIFFKKFLVDLFWSTFIFLGILGILFIFKAVNIAVALWIPSFAAYSAYKRWDK